MIWCEFCSFTRTTIKIPLKFPTFTFNKPKGWLISASNTETNSAAFIMRWWEGDHLNSAMHQGDQKNFTHTVGGSLKIYKTWKISKGPPPGKKWHFPYVQFSLVKFDGKLEPFQRDSRGISSGKLGFMETHWNPSGFWQNCDSENNISFFHVWTYYVQSWKNIHRLFKSNVKQPSSQALLRFGYLKFSLSYEAKSKYIHMLLYMILHMLL